MHSAVEAFNVPLENQIKIWSEAPPGFVMTADSVANHITPNVPVSS